MMTIRRQGNKDSHESLAVFERLARELATLGAQAGTSGGRSYVEMRMAPGSAYAFRFWFGDAEAPSISAHVLDCPAKDFWACTFEHHDWSNDQLAVEFERASLEVLNFRTRIIQTKTLLRMRFELLILIDGSWQSRGWIQMGPFHNPVPISGKEQVFESNPPAR
jgi:hypothetical protein